MVRPQWERAPDSPPDYEPGDGCVQLWRVALPPLADGEPLWGYAEELRDMWYLVIGNQEWTHPKGEPQHPPVGWIDLVAEFWGIVLPEGGA
jgi:hypothetical protein